MQLDSDDDAAEAYKPEASAAADAAADPDALEDDVAVGSSDEDPDENVPSENIPEADNPVQQKQGTLGGMVARPPPGPSMKSDYRCAIRSVMHHVACRGSEEQKPATQGDVTCSRHCWFGAIPQSLWGY